MKKILTYLKNKLTPDNWETVYAVPCFVNYHSVFHGHGKTSAVAKIQVERKKNKYRSVVSAMGDTQPIDIAEICVNSPEAARICEKEGITW